MKTVTIMERDVTPDELARLRAGFEENASDHGVATEASERFGTVALDGTAFVGAASALAYKNGPAFTGWCHLTDLFVEKPYRGRGVGSRLLGTLERTLHQSGIRKMWTWTAGHEAPRFYSKLGYTVFAELEAWDIRGGSRIALRKDLR